MKTLDQLQTVRKNNLNKNFEISTDILEEAETAYESGRQSYNYLAGRDYTEQDLWWERCCPFVKLSFVTTCPGGYNIALTFIEDEEN